MLQSKQLIVQSPGLCLRPTEEMDLDYVLSLEQEEENRRFIMPWEREQHTQALSNPDFAHLIIETEARIGFVLIAGLENMHQCIELRRIVIGPKGRGYGKKALHLIKQLTFEKWKAHRLWLDVFEDNLSARHLYASQGFAYEGTLRECYKVGEQFASLVIMSMLNNEYRDDQ